MTSSCSHACPLLLVCGLQVREVPVREVPVNFPASAENAFPRETTTFRSGVSHNTDQKKKLDKKIRQKVFSQGWGVVPCENTFCLPSSTPGLPG